MRRRLSSQRSGPNIRFPTKTDPNSPNVESSVPQPEAVVRSIEGDKVEDVEEPPFSSSQGDRRQGDSSASDSRVRARTHTPARA